MEMEMVIENDIYQGPLKSDVYKKRVDVSHDFSDWYWNLGNNLMATKIETTHIYRGLAVTIKAS